MSQRDATLRQDHILLETEPPTLLESSSSSRGRKAPLKLDWRQAAGIGLAILGPLLMILGWYGLSGTNRTAEQLSYFLSGGVGGAALLACGLALLISYEHVADRESMARLVERLDRLEFGLASEFDALRADLNGRRHSTGV